MITALLIGNICLLLISKGVPTSFETVLTITYAISSLTAIILWHETKMKIAALLEEKAGGE